MAPGCGSHKSKTAAASSLSIENRLLADIDESIGYDDDNEKQQKMILKKKIQLIHLQQNNFNQKDDVDFVKNLDYFMIELFFFKFLLFKRRKWMTSSMTQKTC